MLHWSSHDDYWINLLKGKYLLEDDETLPTDEENDFSSNDKSEPPDDASYISSLSEKSFGY
eukprot:2124041-Ditylum_brightwellii.AAC.1